jgi:hypothetical protein
VQYRLTSQLPPFHLALAAFFADADRCLLVMADALAIPPLLPNSAAAADFCSIFSSTCPVAIRMTWTALPMTSAGRFWPCGPLGTDDLPFQVLDYQGVF